MCKGWESADEGEQPESLGDEWQCRYATLASTVGRTVVSYYNILDPTLSTTVTSIVEIPWLNRYKW